ncbi:MAG TPA: tail fiber domain-containing protein [Thermoanaerobaculia bacterium]|nr:tail fiber domain-containing protein [Thermoanaerobaculia bacterium]
MKALLLVVAAFSASTVFGQWLPVNANPPDPINRSGSVSILGTVPWGAAVQYIQFAVSPGVLLYGPSAAVHASNVAAGPTVNGVSDVFLGANYSWYAHGGLTAVQGAVTASYLQTNFPNKSAVLRGGFFDANVVNPIPLGSQASGPYAISGVTGQLDGSIANMPVTGVVAGVVGVDNIAIAGTYAGYFQGKGYFTEKVTVVGGALTPASLSASAPAGTALATFCGEHFNGSGAYLEGGKTGGLGVGGAHFTSGATPSETFGLRGIGTSAAVTSTGVHGDAMDGLYGKGVWGSASSATIQNYGVYGDIALGNGFAGYFNGDVYAAGMFVMSDRRYKENIRVMASARSKLLRLTPITFRYSSSPEVADMHLSDQEMPGFDAAEVEAVFPALVKASVHPPKIDPASKTIVPAVDFKAVNYAALIPLLVKALQEQDAVVENLRARIAVLERARAGSNPGEPAPRQ